MRNWPRSFRSLRSANPLDLRVTNSSGLVELLTTTTRAGTEPLRKNRKSSGEKTTGGSSAKKPAATRAQVKTQKKGGTKARGKTNERNDDSSSPISDNTDVAPPPGSDALLQAEPTMSQRNSLDSQPYSLEPLVEEEEMVTSTVTTVPLKDAPSKPTARATPARHSRSLRARSASPNKLPRVTETGDDEHSVSIEGDPVKKKMTPISRRARTNSPSRKLPGDSSDDEILIAVPGSNGVPKLPVASEKSLNGHHTPVSKASAPPAAAVAQAEREEFTWPDDVF